MKLYAETEKQINPRPEPEPPQPEHQTFSYRFKNWWHYHKWYVICGLIAAGILADVLITAGENRRNRPDFQISYVGEAVLPDDTVSALENAFAALGGDFNGDGKVIVKLNQYNMSSQTADAETAAYSYSAEVLLMGDLSAGDSYFFLTDNPEYLQRSFEIFANSDGSCPDEGDISVEDKVILWADCTALAEMELGSYTDLVTGSEVTGENRELVSGLYLGRRYFYDDEDTHLHSQCDALWNELAGSVITQK